MAVATTARADTASLKEGFDGLEVGKAPSGWESGFMGTSGSPHWYIAKDPKAPSAPNVLRQDGKAAYSWLVAPGIKLGNGSVKVRFKVESGKEDPEAGLIARFLDGKNYLYARANVLEHDVILYRMSGGKKEVVKRVETKVTPNDWHEMRFEIKGDDYKVYFDGKGIISLKETSLKDPGRVGLWTTADTVSVFDDFEATGK